LLTRFQVSKSWRSLIYDGQLWINVDLHSFPGIPRVILQHITESAGPFIQTLDVSGLTHLDSEKLLDVTSNLCLMTPYESLSYTQLTSINLQGCAGLTTRSLHHLLIRSRLLKKLNLRGLPAVTNTTCEILATYCPEVTSLNLNRCPNMDADGIHYMATAALARGEHLQLRELRVCGLKHTSDEMMADLGGAAPYLEVLDLSYARRLHNSALDAFVACDDELDLASLGVETAMVSARDLGRDINDAGQVYFRRRVTRLRHLNLSFCILLTDGACANIAYSVPQLEFLELAGIGAELKDAGLIRLFERTPSIRRVDLEDAVDVGDAVLAALTPPPPPLAPMSPSRARKGETLPQTGNALEVLNVSSCINLNDAALLSLVRGCQRLTVLEADGTRMSSTLFREFVRLSKERKIFNAKLGAVDCRGVTESLVKELQAFTRPRLGWRSYASRRLFFLDARDGHDDDMKVAGGQDECDENRVVVKTFYSWQTVDAVKASRERRKAKAAKEAAVSAGSSRGRRVGRGSDGSGYEDVGGRVRWWSPGGRRGSGAGSSGRTSPLGLAEVNDGCRAM
jgi:F-box/leucine-rich repeat protein 2/20